MKTIKTVTRKTLLKMPVAQFLGSLDLKIVSFCMFHSFNNLTEAVTWRCSLKKVFLKISLNSQERTSVAVSFLIKLQAAPTLQKTSGRLLLLTLVIKKLLQASYFRILFQYSQQVVKDMLLLEAYNFIKQGDSVVSEQVFLVNFVEFLRIPILQNIYEQLLQ